jgi:hypothetical protein
MCAVYKGKKYIINCGHGCARYIRGKSILCKYPFGRVKISGYVPSVRRKC